MLEYDIVIIGGGPAGLGAAIEAKKNGIEKILILEREKELGGILNQCIHNGFGLHEFNEELTGPEYSERFIEQIHDLNIQYKLGTMVLDIYKGKRVYAVNDSEGYMTIKCKAIILAMGCRERPRGSINIPGTRPSGVFTAGTAQRFINIEGYMVGKKVFILGSGDIGLIMARRLRLEGAEVVGVADIMPYSGGLQRNIRQCLDDYDIPLMLSHTVTEIRGKNRLEGVIVKKVDDNKIPIDGSEKYFECDTLLLSVGLIPENELSEGIGIKLDERTKGPIVTESLETTTSGIFACGNALHVHDLVDYVSKEGKKAGKNAAKHVKNRLYSTTEHIKTIPKEGIRYIVPQKIDVKNIEKGIDLFFRVDKPYENAVLIISIDRRIISRVQKNSITPSSMGKIHIKKELLERNKSYELTITVVGKECCE